MKRWEGLTDSTVEVDDGIFSINGVSFWMEGQIQRRAGLTQLAAFGGIALGHFRSPLGTSWLLIVTSSGTVETQKL